MRRRTMISAAGAALLGLVLPVEVSAKEQTVTLEVTGMS